MGSGASQNHQVNRRTQIPSAPHTRTRTPSALNGRTRTPPAPNWRTRTPSPQLITKPFSSQTSPQLITRAFSSQPSPWIQKSKTPIPPSHSTLASYASVWEHNGQLSSKFQELIRSESTKIEHNQKEVHTHQLVTKHSSTCETAFVESTLTSEIESIHNLSTSEKIDSLIINLKQTHLNFDESVKSRIGQVTSETESILAQIVEETQQSQQQLLILAKEQQTIQDEQYRILLEEYIAQLDERRAKQLAIIQEQLQEQRLIIFNESQLKFRAVSEQANSVKNQIMIEEERKASEKIDLIITEINSISTESAIQELGTEIKTNINLVVHEVVGSYNTQQLHSVNQNSSQTTKRTVYIENDNVNQTKSINNLLVKQNSTIPKTKSQQPQ